MSIVLRYLAENRENLAVQGFGSSLRLSYSLGSPPFTSCNLTFILFEPESPVPLLVAKVPRLDDAEGCLAREAASLLAVRERWPASYHSVPRLIAFEKYAGGLLLVRTALAGSPMKPAVMRMRFQECVDKALGWLLELHQHTAVPGQMTSKEAADLVDDPLERLQRPASSDGEARKLLAETQRLVAGLPALDFPRVFEHGDFAGRNLFLLPCGRLGVADWEFSAQRGLPLVDLYFFLASVAFARRAARTPDERLAALHEAFFEPDAWTRPYVLRYAEELNIPMAALEPLFILCWCRYVASLTRRKACAGERFLTPESTHRAQHSPHWRFWRHAVQHAGSFSIAQ